MYTGRVDPRVGSGRVWSKYSATLAGRVGSGRQFQNTKKLKCSMLYDRLMVALLFIPHSDKCNLDEIIKSATVGMPPQCVQPAGTAEASARDFRVS